jgi:two-component system NarL family sensor kinase
MPAMASEGALPSATVEPALWPRIAPWIAAGLWLLSVSLALTGVALGVGLTGGGPATAPSGPASFLGGAILAVTYASVALVLGVRRPGNLVGWIFAAIGVMVAAGNVDWALGIRELRESPPDVATAELIGWINPLVEVPGWGLLGITLMLVFPDGRLRDRWSRRIFLLTIAAVAVLAFGLAFSPGALLLIPHLRNPFRLTGLGGQLAELARAGGLALCIVLIFAALWCVLQRYRAAGPVERQQLKWFALGGLAFAAAGSLLALAGGTLLAPGSRVGELAWLGFAAAAALPPIAAAIGILRYRLYEIDEIIGRTFVIGALTAILAGLYSASIRLFNWFFVALTGEESEIALVLTTLILATTFTPIKKRLEGLVESRYPAAEEASSDSQALPATRAELEDLVREVVREERAAATPRRS